MTIWKYELQITDEQSLEIPEGGVVLDVQTQRETVCLWVLVDPHASQITRDFVIHGTGHNIDDDAELKYIGSTQMADGSLVWHVFEKL